MKIDEIFEYINHLDLVSVATVDEDQPHVRLMTLIPYKEKYWCCTKTSRPKSNEILKNNKFELCSVIKSGENIGSIRARGMINVINDLVIKKELANNISFFKGFWKAFDDPEFNLFQMVINRIEIHNPLDHKWYEYLMKGDPILLKKQ